jgi:BMFP domain-containing protein YqiC
MRAKCFPNVQEILSKLNPRTAANLRKAGSMPDILKQGITDTEKLLGHKLLPSEEKRMRITLGDGKYVLPDFPLVRVLIHEADMSRIYLYKASGMLDTTLPERQYDVSYTVGYESDGLPASVQYLLEAVTVNLAVPDTVSREEVGTFVTVILRARKETEEERNRVTEALREKFGQRLGQHSYGGYSV